MSRKTQRQIHHSNSQGASVLPADFALAAEARPRFQKRVLWLGGFAVKRFGRLAQDVELILISFQEQGWIKWIDDPLPPKRGRDPKRRLQDAIRNFNRRLDCPLLRL